MSQKPCPICGSTRSVEPDDHEYRYCKDCGAVRTQFSYDASLYSESYAKNYVSYAETKVNIPLQLCRLGLVSRWLKPKEWILDIGCCVGEFLRFAEEYYSCQGFEPNKKAIAKKRCVQSPIFTELNGRVRSVDCITMFDVLEHIQQPEKFLNTLCNGYLRSNGVLVITTPDTEAIDPWADETLRKWKHYKPKEHLFLYSIGALEILLKKVGMKVIHSGFEESDIRPGNPNQDILTCVARKI